MNIVVFGGNGYIGNVIIEKWLEKDKHAEFFSLSRSGKGQISKPNVHYLKADVTNLEEVQLVLPEYIDYIIDCVGIYTKDKKQLEKYNVLPAKVMLKIAEKKSIKGLGYIGGVMGPKEFTNSKSSVIQMLCSSNHKISYVEPTLVYGNGRNDFLSKMVPLLKFMGIFSKKMQPVKVDDLADELISKLLN
ncbi:NAD-dependent epimerase/dehydratase family protein [Thomasclavelia saccharogumia]|uniref:NAD-dependent epimerase/dehydratase family protein n=1 Tax=Thomasclavelia saccharogumia TaxID=341225 RepID=UPI00047E3B89|nr:NAD-dependent epimerase/dehydratase family protein [Thomasclavelia saccharogumia]